MHIIPESDLFRLIHKSKLPVALDLSTWLFKEVFQKVAPLPASPAPVQTQLTQVRQEPEPEPVGEGKEVIPFSFEGSPIRVMKNELGEPEFIAKDVVETMGSAWGGRLLPTSLKNGKG
jgi:prophage antirepressor-like protein